MIKTNVLEFTEDYTALNINIEKIEYTWNKQVHIEKLYLVDSMNFTGTIPTKELDCIAEILVKKNKHNEQINLTKENYSGKNKLLFIIVEFGGPYNEGTPCGLDVPFEVIAVWDKETIYKASLAYLKQVTSRCEYSKDFIDFILFSRAFAFSIAAKEFMMAKKFWDIFINFRGNKNKISITNSRCNCYG